MDIFHLGHSSFRIKGKTASVITDPFKPSKADFPDIVTISNQNINVDAVKGDNTFIVDGPGEYEIKDVLIVGIKTDQNVIYKITIDGVRFLHLGDLTKKLTDSEIDLIGDVDVLFIPVGGTDTIDAKAAAEVSAQIEASVVIPMHYETPTQFLKEMGVENIEPLPKLTTSKDKLPDTTTVVVLE